MDNSTAESVPAGTRRSQVDGVQVFLREACTSNPQTHNLTEAVTCAARE